MIIVHACTIIIVHARTMTIVHACTMIIVHARTMIIVHACTRIMVHVSCPTRLMFSAIQVGGRAPQESGGGVLGAPGPPMPVVRNHLHPPPPPWYKKVTCKGLLEYNAYSARRLAGTWHGDESQLFFLCLIYSRRGNPARLEGRRIT